MSNIGGSKREHKDLDFGKKVGLFEAKVIAINPTEEQFKTILDIELKDDSKATDYLSEREGNTLLRIDVWLEQTNKKLAEDEKPYRTKVSFFLEDKLRENKDGTKQQYINELGSCSWADDPNNLPDWFVKREYRQAYVGEEDLYNFLRTWLCELDYRSEATTLQVEWKKLMKGNVKDLKDQINGEWCGTIVPLATVIVKDVEGEMKEYQGIYNKAFLPAYSLKNFRLIDYSNPKLIADLHAKKPKDLKTHEKFVVNVTGEYGCKNFYILRDLQDYNPDDNLVASDKPISEEGDDY
jgi:hypothetical protein